MIAAFIIKNSHTFIKELFHSRSSHSFTLKDIHCYGSLIVRCPSIPIHVKPINPHDVPHGDKSFIDVQGNIDLRNMFDVGYKKDKSVITVIEKDVKLKDILQGSSIHIQVPHIYNIDIEALSVKLEETECDTLKLLAKEDCLLGKIKTINANILSYGSFNCTNFSGNGSLKVHGSISISKLQSLDIVIDGNDVDITNIYCPDFKCNTITGKINIKNFHGVADLISKSGAIFIGSSDGDLNVQTDSGNIEVALEKFMQSCITSCTGDIDIGVSDSISTFIEAKGNCINIPEDLLIDGMKMENSSGYQHFEGKLGDGASTLEVSTISGSINISRKNWFSQFHLLH